MERKERCWRVKEEGGSFPLNPIKRQTNKYNQTECKSIASISYVKAFILPIGPNVSRIGLFLIWQQPWLQGPEHDAVHWRAEEPIQDGVPLKKQTWHHWMTRAIRQKKHTSVCICMHIYLYILTKRFFVCVFLQLTGYKNQICPQIIWLWTY